MMNVNNHGTDSGLDLGISNQDVETRRSNGNPGAGVNAASCVDMELVAPDLLSELVWSPKHGLSLKSAGKNCAYKRSRLRWDSGAASLLLPSQSVMSKDSKDEKPTSEENSVRSQGTTQGDSEVAKRIVANSGNSSASHGKIHVDSQVAKFASVANSPACSNLPLFGSSNCHTELVAASYDKIKEVKNVERTSIVRVKEGEGRYMDKENELSSYSIEISNKSNTGQENRTTVNFLPLLKNEPSGSKDLDIDIGLASISQRVQSCDVLESQLPKQAVSERNDWVISSASCAPFLQKLESCSENDVKYPTALETCGRGGERAQKDESVPCGASLNDNRLLLHRMKGKEKVNSSCNKESSNDEADSNGSMESCSSANLISKRKRRYSFDQELIVGSKRVKQKIQESPPSTSIRRSSSFINWISNMVKGVSKSNQEAGHSLALTIGRSNVEHESSEKKTDSHDKNKDFGSRNKGFQAIFKSLYCPSTKRQDTQMPNDNFSVGGYKDLVLAEEVCDDFKRTTSEHHDSPLLTWKNKLFRNPVSGEAKDRASSSGTSFGDGQSQSPFCKEPVDNICNTTEDPLRSLWVARYFLKAPHTILNPFHTEQHAAYISIPSDEKSEARESTDEVSDVGPRTEATTGIKKISTDHCKSPITIKSCTSLNNPDEMASIFARRLDALKSIAPANVRVGTSHVKTSSFFGGHEGNKLVNCSDLKENDMEGLLSHISLYDEEEAGTPFCIKCFQIDHWVSSCPWGSKLQQATGSMPKEGSPETSGIFKGIGNRRLFSGKRILVSDAPPEGIFDTVRRLRLSRTSIIKWMSSHTPVSHLNGYFLRLRLAKCEDGLGDSGYYVACITVAQGKQLPESSKNRIRVSIGDTECLVESQHISNSEFLEEELIAWWHRTLKSGQLPAEDQLKLKIEERKALGL